MAELALRTTEFNNTKGDRAYWRPKGSVIVSISDFKIKKKWIEIICDLASPTKMLAMPLLSTRVPGMNYVQAAWSGRLRQKWNGSPLNQINYVPTQADVDDFWNTHIVPLGVLSVLPKANGDSAKGAYETWPWTPKDKTLTHVRIADTFTDREFSEAADTEERADRGKTVISPKNVYDYTVDPGLTRGQIDNIDDQRTEVEVDHSIKLNNADLAEPVLTDRPGR